VQLELSTRLGLDLEALRFGSFVPGLTGGADVVSRSGDGASATSLVPAIGAGIRSEAF
jgi:hypothetical protein